jgi:toxin ParE1/3/4
MIDIVNFTSTTWGNPQARRYHAMIDKAFDIMKRYPGAGHKSSELPDPYRLYQVGAHVIVFYACGDTIFIVRVLHQRMSLKRHIAL